MLSESASFYLPSLSRVWIGPGDEYSSRKRPFAGWQNEFPAQEQAVVWIVEPDLRLVRKFRGRAPKSYGRSETGNLNLAVENSVPEVPIENDALVFLRPQKADEAKPDVGCELDVQVVLPVRGKRAVAVRTRNLEIDHVRLGKR